MSRPGFASSIGVAAALLVVGLAAPSPARAASTGNVNLLFGQKALEKGDWEPVHDQTQVGAEVTFGKESWPILLAADIFGTSSQESASGVDLEGRTAELALGGRKLWEVGRARPFLGGGINFVVAELEVSVPGASVKEDKDAVGIWIGGGAFWRLGPWFNLGFSARAGSAKVRLSGTDTNASSLQYGLLLGYGWPPAK